MAYLCLPVSSCDFTRCQASSSTHAGKRAYLQFARMTVQIRSMDAHDDRLTATLRYLADEALDALVAVNFGQNSFLESHAVFVLSGVRPIGESAVVVERDGRSSLVVTPAWDAERAKELSRTSKTIGTNHLAETLETVLRDRSVDTQNCVSVGL